MCCLAPFCRWLAPFLPLAAFPCFVPPCPHSCTFLLQSAQLHWTPWACQTLRFVSLPVATFQFACGFLITQQSVWQMRSVSCLCSSVGFVPLCVLVYGFPLYLLSPSVLKRSLTRYPLGSRGSPLLHTLAQTSLPLFREVENLASVWFILSHDSFILYFLKPFQFHWKCKSFQKGTDLLVPTVPANTAYSV